MEGSEGESDALCGLSSRRPAKVAHVCCLSPGRPEVQACREMCFGPNRANLNNGMEHVYCTANLDEASIR